MSKKGEQIVRRPVLFMRHIREEPGRMKWIRSWNPQLPAGGKKRESTMKKNVYLIQSEMLNQFEHADQVVGSVDLLDVTKVMSMTIVDADVVTEGCQIASAQGAAQCAVVGSDIEHSQGFPFPV